MTTTIHSTAIVDPAAELGEDVIIGPYTLIGPNVRLGAGARVASHVVIEGHAEIGPDCEIHPFASLGAPPQHTGHRGEPTRLVVGARNIIREHVTMHCGTVMGRGVTTVGSDGFFMVGVHIAHDCIVGDHVTLVNNATLGGHVRVEDYVIMGGLSAAHQYTRIGRHAFVGGMAGVNHDVIPFGNVWGNHAHLEGLNLVGLKRRGFSRETINILRAAYRLLFAEEGTFQERVDDAAATFAGSPEVMEIIDFIRADSNRPLTTPQREV
jgi:UDP-N-acetylglucosamine acyltransferase